jgi:hypothetical protein
MGSRWAKFADEVLPEFLTDSEGRIYNSTQYKAWQAAKERHYTYVERRHRKREKKGAVLDESGDYLEDSSRSSQVNSRISPDNLQHISSQKLPGLEFMKEKEKEKKKKDKDYCAEASSTPEQPLLTFPLSGQGTARYSVDAANLPAWAEAYPGVDVLRELFKMREWLEANPRRRKTVRGVPSFIVAWLSREQDSGRGVQVAKATQATVGMMPQVGPGPGHVPLADVLGEETCRNIRELWDKGTPRLDDLALQFIREETGMTMREQREMLQCQGVA